MGKPYESEIKNFKTIYEWTCSNPIKELTAFVHYASRTPLYIVGSGGSFTATTFASMLHQQAGMMARCLTPLEFLNYNNIRKNNSILIVTAGGNNKDILSALDKAISIEPKHLGILCASINNKLTKKAQNIPRIFLSQHDLPTKKDGFLATNSLIATMIWLIRAYLPTITLPRNLDTLVYPNSTEAKFKNTLEKELSNFKNVSTLVVLYDNWGKTAAVDAESKLVEAGLINVQLADYRNFAHGRHNWIGKNPNSTGIISLINPDCKELASNTLKLIPRGIPTAKFETKYSGSIGALALLIRIMYAVKVFGDFRKIDPGRPGVAAFGRKIYHLSTPKPKIPPDHSKIEYIAIQRKFGEITDKKSFQTKLSTLKQFLKKIDGVKFDSIVFDYDGTLCDPSNQFRQPSEKTIESLITILQKKIHIGIATGRGKSVRNELQHAIPEKFWPNVYIGYYNCAEIATLDKNDKPDTKTKTDPKLTKFLKYLQENKIVNGQANTDVRPKQISIADNSLSALDLIKSVNTMNSKLLNTVKIVESSHSLDIISNDVSKLNLLRKFKNELNFKNILCIGDKGLWPGNDFELLGTKYSLSVDEVNRDPDSCWNLAPLGHKGEQAFHDYYGAMHITNTKLQIKLKIGGT